jgi:hypothetical protein
MCQNKRRKICFNNRDKFESCGHYVFALVLCLSIFCIFTIHHMLTSCKENKVDRAKDHPEKEQYGENQCELWQVVIEALESKALYWFVTWFSTWLTVFSIKWKWGKDKIWFREHYGDVALCAKDVFGEEGTEIKNVGP